MLTESGQLKKIKFGGSLPGIIRDIPRSAIKTCGFCRVVYIFDHKCANINQYYTKVGALKKTTSIAGIMDIDDIEDWLEVQDPKMQKQIAEGYKEYRQGETRPLDEFLSEERH